MKIAVTYENGEVFQHFGHCENFKIYQVENNEIVSSEVISANGQGHGALAGFLSENNINVVICGGLGEGALNALTEAGIEVCAGASGDTDVAVVSYLYGDLKNSGANCDHHDHEEDGSGCGGCGGGCGGCGGGCGPRKPAFEGPNVGKNVRVHYQGTFNDGTEFDSSYGRGETLDFVCGAGMMIPGFDKAVATMEVGQTVNIHLMPEEAYGPKDPDAIFTLPLEQLPGSEDLNAGESVYLYNQFGQPVPVTVVEKTETEITFDANHEMAGKELNFKIELVEVQ